MPRLKRYAYTQLIAFFLGLVTFVVFYLASGWVVGFRYGFGIFVTVIGIFLIPQLIRDKKEYMKLGRKWDEMEREIKLKAQAVSLWSIYSYVAVAILALQAIYSGTGVAVIEISRLNDILLGMIIVLLTSDSVAILILYGREPKETADAEQ